MHTLVAPWGTPRRTYRTHDTYTCCNSPPPPLLVGFFPSLSTSLRPALGRSAPLSTRPPAHTVAMRPSKGAAGLREHTLAAAVARRLPSHGVLAACRLCHSLLSASGARAQPSSHCAHPPLVSPVTCVRRGGRRYLLHPWYPSGHRSPPSQLRAPAVGPLVSNSQKPNGRRVWSPRAKTVSPRPPTASLRFPRRRSVRCALRTRRAPPLAACSPARRARSAAAARL